MFESIYILDTASAALILQHTYTGRPPPTSLLEYFQSLILNDPHTPPPSIVPVPSNVVTTPTVLFHTRSSNNSITLLSPVTQEPHDAAGVVELLIRIMRVLEDYFGKEKLGRGIVEGNFDVVEELLGEIIDNGEIMTTEPNALRDIVLPPSLLNKVMSAAGLQGYLTFLLPLLTKIICSIRHTVFNTMATDGSETQDTGVLCRYNRVSSDNPVCVVPS